MKRAPTHQLQVDLISPKLGSNAHKVFFIYYETAGIFKLLVLERSHILVLNKGGLSISEKKGCGI